jgi:hypothetical protein
MISIRQKTSSSSQSPSQLKTTRRGILENFCGLKAEEVDVKSEKYKKMVEQEHFLGGEGGILGAMEKYKLDVLVVPAGKDIANDLAAKMGLPAISVPLGFWILARGYAC